MNVLILGAGLMQRPAIISAKELGCRVFVADGNPNAPCSSIADEFKPIDLKDRDGLLAYAEKIEKQCGTLDAVFTAGTDFSANVAYIAEHFGLKGHSYQSALNASDKVRMRTCFKTAGVNSPEFFEVNENNLPENSVKAGKLLLKNKLDFPLVVKPCDNMGGRGCRKVFSTEELAEAARIAIDNSRSRRAIVEQFMDGREFSIDSLVVDGNVTITGFAERHIFYPPYFIEMGHTISAELSKKDYDSLKSEFVKGIHALGLTNGVAKADIKLTSNGAMIGEIAARLSGGYMSGWTFPYASGINLTRQALLIALNRKCEIPLCGFGGHDVKPSKTCAERAWISIPGKISRIYGLENATKISGVKDVLPRAKDGDIVVFPTNNVEKCGNVISLDENREKAIDSACKAVASIVIRLEKDKDVTSDFLTQSLDIQYPPSAFAVSEKEYENFTLNFDKEFSLKLENLLDWNYRSIKDTLLLFTEITGIKEKNIKNCAKFWRYLLRGGIQGILYYYDTNTEDFS